MSYSNSQHPAAPVGESGARSLIGAPTWRGPMPPAQRARLEADIEAAYRQAAQIGRRTHRTRQNIVDNTVRVYADLHGLGYVGLKIDNLRPEHLLNLVRFWRAGVRDADGCWLRRPLARRSAANFWTAINAWLPTIGKSGMVRPFVEVWPDDGQDPGAADRPVRRGGIAELDEDTYAAILQAWLGDPPKRTHYWLLRAVHELGLDIGEALALNPRTAAMLVPGRLVVKKFAQRNRRIIDLDSEAKRALVADLISFVDEARRTRLGWHLREVKSDALAERRLRNAVAYARDRIEGRSATVHTTSLDTL